MNGKILGLMMLVTIGLYSGCGDLATGQMTTEQYKAVNMEMSEDEVREMAGEPELIQENASLGDLGHNPNPGTIWYYNRDAESMHIYFQNGKVVHKEQR